MIKPERLLLFGILVAALAACGTPATPGPTLQPTLVLPTRVPVQATTSTENANRPTSVAAQPTVLPTTAPTLAPTKPAAASPTLIPVSPTKLPATVSLPATATKASATVSGDPAKGQALFANGFGDPAVPACNTCHNIDTAEVKVGPALKSLMGHIQPHLKPGQSIPDYLRISILKPNDFIVPNDGSHIFSASGISLMFQDYSKHLSDAQVNDLVAYLTTLK